VSKEKRKHLLNNTRKVAEVERRELRGAHGRMLRWCPTSWDGCHCVPHRRSIATFKKFPPVNSYRALSLCITCLLLCPCWSSMWMPCCRHKNPVRKEKVSSISSYIKCFSLLEPEGCERKILKNGIFIFNMIFHVGQVSAT
jgi:hypothetical protein